jgi:site-specific DNA recombinase
MILSNPVYIGKHTTFKHDVRNTAIRPEAEWVVSDVPAIVDEATFRRAGAVLEQRGFAKREAKAKQSPTLLAGLLTCDLCGRRIRPITAKYGKYHYYSCATKSETSATACDCPYLPKEVFDDVICSALSKELLSSKRLVSIMAELNAAIKLSAAPDFKRLQDAKRAMSSNAAKVAALYDEIGAGKLLLDGSLSAYPRDQQNQLATLKEEVETLTHRYQLPLKKFGRTQIAGFAASAKDALLTPNSPLARGHLLATVAEIRVGRKTAVVSGGSLQLAAAVAQWVPGITPSVPKVVSEWRARQLRKVTQLCVLTAHKMLPLDLNRYFDDVSI